MDTHILIPTLKIYIFEYSGWTDRQTDGQRHHSGVGWVTTLAAHGLEELFSAILERFLLHPKLRGCSERR
jgi:hypothetical protein